MEGDDLMTEKFNIKSKEELYKQICRLSEYINKLNLDKEKNDQLIDLIVKQFKMYEKEFFIHGFKSGIEYQVDQILEQSPKEYMNHMKYQ